MGWHPRARPDRCHPAGANNRIEKLPRDPGTYAANVAGIFLGAWFCYFLAAQNPHLLLRLVLVSSPPFEEVGARQLSRTRFDRLSPPEQAEFSAAIAAISRPDSADWDGALARLGALAGKPD